jgi:hypothetical protein
MNLSVGGIVSLGGTPGSGTSGGGSTSGIVTINNQFGPAITIVGLSGITVLTTLNTITIVGPGSGISTVSKFAAAFSSIVSGIFTHNLGTVDVIVQVFDTPGGGGKVILPDQIIVENANQISLTFNRPQSGKVVII